MGDKDMGNALLLIQLLTTLLGQAQQITNLINKARAEGRDVTNEELAALYADDDVARAKLQALIESAS